MPDIPTEKRLLAEANRHIAEVERILKDAETQLRTILRKECDSEERYKQIAFMKEILQTMEHHRDFIVNEFSFAERPLLSPLSSASGGLTAA